MNGTEFDVFSNGFVKITKENVQKAKEIIESDPFYKKAYKSVEDSSTKSFCDYKEEYKKDKKAPISLKLLEQINTENSTRVKNDYLKEVVLKNLNYLGSNLEQKLKNQDYSIIPDIYTIKDESKTKETQKTLLSYASKFCHFYCLHMFDDTTIADSFPIIDSILRKVIPIYDYLYNDKEYRCYDEYKKNSSLYKYRNAEYKDIKPSVLEYYKIYVNALSCISENCQKQVTVTEIEQLLWWFYRGIADDIDRIKDEK